MKLSYQQSKSGFTLVEIMIVVAIIGLLAALAVPGFIRSRARSQGERIMNDARIMDHAIDEWSIEAGKKLGDPVDTVAAAGYLKAAWPVNDILGNPYTFTVVGATQIQINAVTKTALTGYNIDWGNY